MVTVTDPSVSSTLSPTVSTEIVAEPDEPTVTLLAPRSPDATYSPVAVTV